MMKIRRGEIVWRGDDAEPPDAYMIQKGPINFKYADELATFIAEISKVAPYACTLGVNFITPILEIVKYMLTWDEEDLEFTLKEWNSTSSSDRAGYTAGVEYASKICGLPTKTAKEFVQATFPAGLRLAVQFHAFLARGKLLEDK
jgi:hypothetical protein